VKKIYFIGIGGIGMSAIARYFMHEGKSVAGYDRTPTPLTQALESDGAHIHYIENVMQIPLAFRTTDTLVIYTPAINADNLELHYFRQNGNKIIKRSEALGYIASNKKVLAVAGTHGKTSTSTMLAHLLTAAGNGCTAFLGGISKNYNSNLLLAKNNLLVAEADEFDRSFLRLFPDIAVVTSVDADHLDIFGSHEEVKKAFKDFVGQIKPNGTLIVKKSLSVSGKPSFALHFSGKVYTYSFDEEADFYAKNIEPQQGGYYKFDLVTPGGTVQNCTVGIPGWVNVENAVAASAVAWCAGVKLEKLPQAIQSFQGVKRRFDILVNTPTLSFIDDYAHHPEELRAAITSIREMFPERKITGIFQPHLYTRTRDFASEFAQSLSLLDELILLDIYPAREKPIRGVTSSLIFDKVTISNKILCKKDSLLKTLKNKKFDVLVTFGAGNIDDMLEQIKTTILSE
jgi:UDP-N-acetylmuramate--alanine ligase